MINIQSFFFNSVLCLNALCCVLQVLGVRQPVPLAHGAGAPQGGVRALVRGRAERGPALGPGRGRGQPGDGVQRGAGAAAVSDELPPRLAADLARASSLVKGYCSYYETNAQILGQPN